MPPDKAGPAEIVRSAQKDAYYLSKVERQISDLIQHFLGPFYAVRFHKEISLATNLMYYTLTTSAGYQTLGEEYCHIIQFDENNCVIPSWKRRLSMVVAHCIIQYCDRKYLEKFLETDAVIEQIPSNLREILTKLPDVVQKLHLGLFYLHGAFYHFGKRLLGVHYVTIRRHPMDITAKFGYKLLGWLSLLQVFMFAGKLLIIPYSNYLKSISSTNGRRDTSLHSAIAPTCPPFQGKILKCLLCLDSLRDATATPCGHLFCWQCIMDWCSFKPECPSCRDSAYPSSLIYVYQLNH